MKSDTPKFDSMLDYLKSLSIKENQAVVAYAKRLCNTGLGTPTLEMVKDFVAVIRAERVPQHLLGDGFDWIEVE